jgi:hypothetical protein
VLRTHIGEGTVASKVVLEKLDIHTKKNENGPLSHSLYKNKLKMG